MRNKERYKSHSLFLIEKDIVIKILLTLQIEIYQIK